MFQRPCISQFPFILVKVGSAPLLSRNKNECLQDSGYAHRVYSVCYFTRDSCFGAIPYRNCSVVIYWDDDASPFGRNHQVSA